jgi:signal transduction histidine kinase
MNQLLLKSEIKTESDIVWARKKSRELSQFLRLDKQEQTRLATAVSEIARNAFQYAGRGTVEFNLNVEDDKVWIMIQIKDQGPGIRDLEQILAGTYVSPQGMGVGIIGSRKLVDDLKIVSGPQGTTMTLKKYVPIRKGPLTQGELKNLMDIFVIKATDDPMDEIRKQNEEILLTISALNEKKEELSRLNQELEDTNRGVVALYAELDEKAEFLRIANETKTSFLSDMTHEFRSPLNSILSISEFLLEEAQSEEKPEREKQVKFIIKAARGLSDLVNDLLDIAKIEAGKILVRVELFEVQDLFSTLRGLMRPIGGINPAVNFTIEEPWSIISLNTDEGKVAQILRNLISNAIKYTEKGDITVSARDFDDHVEFQVADTGIGISEKNLEIIFSEFVQIDNPLQKKSKGTGLGLPLSKRLATLLGGTLSVESNEGEGSVFTLSLPKNYSGPSDALYHLPQQQPLFPKKPITKILIIDDDEAHRFKIIKTFKKMQLEITEATNGLEGLEKARTFLPDLIILDLIMPKMDGQQFLREAMSDEKLKDIPVIMNTSKDLLKEELEYFEQVTSLVITKEDNEISKIEKIIQDILVHQRNSHV